MPQSLRKCPPVLRHFSRLQDPRLDRKKLHLLSDILVITICAVICGAEKWTEIALFGKAKKKWFKKFLELPNGIPSHDPFGRVFSIIDPDVFRSCFASWIACVREKTNGEIIPIDGKTLRNSFDKATSKTAIHMVSAWGTANRCVLGQVKVDEKSNEITAIPRLLDLLDISGCIVTMDAMGCQKEHARKIKEMEGDYVLALKGNQGHFHAEVKMFFEEAMKNKFADVPHQAIEKVEKDHGRIEIRKYKLVTDLEWFEKAIEWPGLGGVGMVASERRTENGISKEVRYFATSLVEKQPFANAIRQHWQVENNLHWTLDVVFQEDKCRIRKDHSPENLGIVRHIALNQLMKEKSEKLGTKAKRLKAGWNEPYLLKVIMA